MTPETCRSLRAASTNPSCSFKIIFVCVFIFLTPPRPLLGPAQLAARVVAGSDEVSSESSLQLGPPHSHVAGFSVEARRPFLLRPRPALAPHSVLKAEFRSGVGGCAGSLSGAPVTGGGSPCWARQS